MKPLQFYNQKNLLDTDSVFTYFVETILSNNRTWEYFINWNKVNASVSKYKIELNILNSLCRSKNFDEELFYILKEYPQVVKVFPSLYAIRENQIDVLDSTSFPEFTFKNYNFQNTVLTDLDIDNLVLFFEKSGLKKLLIEEGITNIRDYTYGVEVGLDSNGRKNRSGTIMENFVHLLLKNVYEFDDNDYTTQGSPKKINKKWKIDLPIDKSSRRPDFVVYKNNQLFCIETNFYSGGGSKLKATCGEYKALFDFYKSNGIEFIWVTDGEGWKTTLNPLKETFIHNDHIFNLSMIKDGVLNEVWG
ncbi:MAG: type II restriction endonuclease [Flavobacteriaceae bacterium]|nr:type II restriction endonuclease [Flavobacteriaceae bacterium]